LGAVKCQGCFRRAALTAHRVVIARAASSAIFVRCHNSAAAKRPDRRNIAGYGASRQFIKIFGYRARHGSGLYAGGFSGENNRARKDRLRCQQPAAYATNEQPI